MPVKTIPMPMLGNTNTTLPSALNASPPRKIATRITVPSVEGLAVQRKQPPTLKSPVLTLTFAPDSMSITSASAMN